MATPDCASCPMLVRSEHNQDCGLCSVSGCQVLVDCDPPSILGPMPLSLLRKWMEAKRVCGSECMLGVESFRTTEEEISDAVARFRENGRYLGERFGQPDISKRSAVKAEEAPKPKPSCHGNRQKGSDRKPKEEWHYDWHYESYTETRPHVSFDLAEYEPPKREGRLGSILLIAVSMAVIVACAMK